MAVPLVTAAPYLDLAAAELKLKNRSGGWKQERDQHRYDWRNLGGCEDDDCHYHAREKQLAPGGDWLVWLLRTGRQWGKTRTGAEWVREQIEDKGRRHIALVSDTAADCRHVMIEHPKSGILAVSKPDFRPYYEPSKRRVTWPNGAIATTYSAEDPEQLRGPQHDASWCDEVAKWKRQRETWDNLMFGLTLGDDPRCIVTTTPRPTKLIIELSKLEDVHLTLGHTYENLSNLASSVREAVFARYEGTRLGRQELAGELLEDAEDALWRRSWIEDLRVDEAPELFRVVVALDPSGSSDEDADEQGIIVAGVGICRCRGEAQRHGFVTRDLSGHYTPNGWARRAVAAYKHDKADRILAETNFGGEMVEATLRSVDKQIAYRAVHASRGKQVRAEPIAALYEPKQQRVHHVGTFPELEDELCTWVPGEGQSPNRLDALVWALTDLLPNRPEWQPPAPMRVW